MYPKKISAAPFPFNRRLARSIGWVVMALLGMHGFGVAQDQEKSEEALGQAAANATNPLAFVTKFQVQPNFTFKEEQARQLSLITRILQPSPTIGLPFIKSKDPSRVYTIYRLEAPLIGQTFPQAPALDATGLSDLILLDAVVFKKDWGLLGVGPGLILPTASDRPLGSGKWSAGLAGVYLNTRTKGLQFGILAQQYLSFAGDSDRPDQNFMLFQPIFNKILGNGYFLQFSPIMNFNWEQDTYTVPLAVGFGRAFARNLSMFIAPEYVVSGPNRGDFTIRLNINTMFAPPGGNTP